MIEIEINGQKYNASEVTPGFLNEQIRRRHSDGMSVCIRIRINKSNVDIALSCGECGGGAGGGRQLTNEEREIFDLWSKFGCNGGQLNPGKLVAFINQIK